MKKQIKVMFVLLLFVGLFHATGVFAAGKTMNCGEGMLEIPDTAVDILHSLYVIIKIATPVTMIAMGSLDLMKAVMGADANEIKKKQKQFVRRLLAGGMVFLVLSVVEFAFNLVGGDTWQCANGILNGTKAVKK